jgi:hypothetical protein
MDPAHVFTITLLAWRKPASSGELSRHHLGSGTCVPGQGHEYDFSGGRIVHSENPSDKEEVSFQV